ncbi:MAG: 3-dehydroquinate synthase [Chloroflexi bacterium]|nr:3-dehydroquinate synthase [Chloroflexota bacterium]
MDQGSHSRIFLIGFSATGKSRIAGGLAGRLGWEAVDTDEEITRLAGKSVADIFSQDGEPRFREMEEQVLAEAGRKRRVVIACGGGAVTVRGNRRLMKEGGFVVRLEASPEAIHRRLAGDAASSGGIRPLLVAADPLERIRELKSSREQHYAIADWTVHTDRLTLEEAQQEVLRGWYYWRRAHPGGGSADLSGDRAAEVVTATSHYPVEVGWGLLPELGRRLARAGLTGPAYLISDQTVAAIYGDTAMRSLREAGIRAEQFVVSPGEATKTLDTCTRIYDWLIGNRAERSHTIVALGGGVVGDLVGYAAATFLRGLPVVQVPTSLIAMTDAAIGGKTAVNHPRGKNLIGAFHQPRLVLIDVQTLATLGRRETVSGWAEVVKHGVVLDPALFACLRGKAAKLLALEAAATTEAVRRSVAVKAIIVSEDERESGRRMLLNYGHTIGHALEAATGYQRFSHGEAVAIGMTGAAMLAHDLGLLPRDVLQEQSALLQAFGLPARCSGVDTAGVLEAMEMDKKASGGALRWVLLSGVGNPVIRNDVPEERVRDVLGRLLSER